MSGVIRAAKRLATKRAANVLIPDCPIYTRQQRRAKERAAAKLTRVSPAEAGRRVMKVKRATKRQAVKLARVTEALT